MLNLNLIRENPELIKQNNKIRHCSIAVEKILELDKQNREIIQNLGDKREKKNKMSYGRGQKPADSEIKIMKKLSEEIRNIELKQKEIQEKLNKLLVRLPNITDKSVPIGKNETENVVHKKWSPQDTAKGEILPHFNFKPKEHFELDPNKHLIDIQKGAEVSGARFWYLKNELVYLEAAILHYGLQFLKDRGFTPILPPVLVKEKAMFGTGFFPAEENEYYKINANPDQNEENDLYLIGTAEVPLAAYHLNEVLNLTQPKKYAGFSSCFRKEAGAYGKDLKGILRGHQFDKIEMFIFVSQENSWPMHEYLLKIAEEFWQSLEIPYHVLLMCSGDIGAPNAKKYDIEAWLPGQNRYREVGSCSNDTNFQARRLNIKYKNPAGQKIYAHTLNNTLCAMGRTIIAIMENYQQADGSILIPEVLKPYMFGIERIVA